MTDKKLIGYDLASKIYDGDATLGDFNEFFGEKATLAMNASQGSMGAARTLHEAVIPSWAIRSLVTLCACIRSAGAMVARDILSIAGAASLGLAGSYASWKWSRFMTPKQHPPTYAPYALVVQTP